MSDDSLITRKDAARLAALMVGLGVIVSLFAGYVLRTIFTGGLGAVFGGRGGPLFAVLTPVILAAALVGLTVGAYTSGKHLFSKAPGQTSVAAGILLALIYAAFLLFILISKYKGVPWTDHDLGVAGLTFVAWVIAFNAYHLARSIKTGDWSHWKPD